SRSAQSGVSQQRPAFAAFLETIEPVMRHAGEDDFGMIVERLNAIDDRAAEMLALDGATIARRGEGEDAFMRRGIKTKSIRAHGSGLRRDDLNLERAGPDAVGLEPGEAAFLERGGRHGQDHALIDRAEAEGADDPIAEPQLVARAIAIG